MLYFLCFLCVVVIILIYIKFRLKNLNISTHASKKKEYKECKNKLIKYISPQKINIIIHMMAGHANFKPSFSQIQLNLRKF